MRGDSFVHVTLLQLAFLQPSISFDVRWSTRSRWTAPSTLLSPASTRPCIQTASSVRALHSTQYTQSTVTVCKMSQCGPFRTEIEITPWPPHTHVGYDDAFLLIGSCFSENIGQRLARSKMLSVVNPSHGLVFNPLSTASSLDRMTSGKPYGEDDRGVVFNEETGLWSSLEHHSSFSCTSRYPAPIS